MRFTTTTKSLAAALVAGLCMAGAAHAADTEAKGVSFMPESVTVVLDRELYGCGLVIQVDVEATGLRMPDCIGNGFLPDAKECVGDGERLQPGNAATAGVNLDRAIGDQFCGAMFKGT